VVRTQIATIAPASPEEQQRTLDQAREYALNYSKRLPDFICTQVTRRFVDPNGLEFWQQVDVITERLSYFEQREDYKVVMVNNRMVDIPHQNLDGATSTGEFGSMLRELFEPSTQAQFRWERWTTLRGRRTHVFTYRVAQPNSKWHISYERTQEIAPGYKGLLYVDHRTQAVVKITLDAEGIPPAFPIQQASTTLDYDLQTIGDTQFMLPLKAVVRMRSGKVLTKNEVEFRMYRKFGSDVTITFTPDALSEESTAEQGAPKQ
jgi:hypothetical protein